jgi:hypothetical protein
MDRNRYKEWTLVFDWFGTVDTKQVVARENWNQLWELLNALWQEERKNATPEELAAHSGALQRLNS